MVRLSFETVIVRIYSFYFSLRNFYTAKRNETKQNERENFGRAIVSAYIPLLGRKANAQFNGVRSLARGHSVYAL